MFRGPISWYCSFITSLKRNGENFGSQIWSIWFRDIFKALWVKVLYHFCSNEIWILITVETDTPKHKAISSVEPGVNPLAAFSELMARAAGSQGNSWNHRPEVKYKEKDISTNYSIFAFILVHLQSFMFGWNSADMCCFIPAASPPPSNSRDGGWWNQSPCMPYLITLALGTPPSTIKCFPNQNGQWSQGNCFSI